MEELDVGHLVFSIYIEFAAVVEQVCKLCVHFLANVFAQHPDILLLFQGIAVWLSEVVFLNLLAGYILGKWNFAFYKAVHFNSKNFSQFWNKGYIRAAVTRLVVG